MRFGDFKIKSEARQQKVVCPQCALTRKRPDTSLSINLDSGAYYCHRCALTGIVEEKKISMQTKIYVKPPEPEEAVGQKILDWFAKRSISAETVKRFRIKEKPYFFPSAGKELRAILFCYYRDSQLINIKYRSSLKHFALAKDAELIFYNLDAVFNKEEVIICEGEIDCLSIHEAGFGNVISVPNGASKGGNLLYLDNCYGYFDNKTKIILATDNDDPGHALQKELTRRLSPERIWIIQYPEDCKDANDVLVKFGREKLKEVIDSARQAPIEGVLTVEDMEKDINRLYSEGLPVGKMIYGLKDLLTFARGELTFITGIPSHGKSDFLDQIMIKLAVYHNWTFGVFSPENQPTELHFMKLAEKFTGKNLTFNPTMSVVELAAAKNFVNDHFYFMKMAEMELTIENILQKALELVKRKGIDALVIDPWNYIEHAVPPGCPETQYVNEVLTKIKNFKNRYSLAVFVVAHPRKMGKKKNSNDYEVPTLYDISGSAHFFNRIDNGITVYRNFELGRVEVYVQKVRFKFMGRQGMVCFNYQLNSGRFTTEDAMEDDMNNWLKISGKEESFNELKLKYET